MNVSDHNLSADRNPDPTTFLPKRPDFSAESSTASLLAQNGEVIVPASSSPFSKLEIKHLLSLAEQLEYKPRYASALAPYLFRHHAAYFIHPREELCDTKGAHEMRSILMAPELLAWFGKMTGMENLEISRLQTNWYYGQDFLGAHDHKEEGRVSVILSLQELHDVHTGDKRSIPTHFVEDWSSGSPVERVSSLQSGDWVFTLSSEPHGVLMNPFYGREFSRDRIVVVYFLS